MIHIVIPEGLNRLDSAGQPLSDYYQACLLRVAEMAANGEAVYLAPGNAFGHAHPEDEIAAGFLQQLRSDLITYHVGTPDRVIWIRWTTPFGFASGRAGATGDRWRSAAPLPKDRG